MGIISVLGPWPTAEKFAVLLKSRPIETSKLLVTKGEDDKGAIIYELTELTDLPHKKALALLDMMLPLMVDVKFKLGRLQTEDIEGVPANVAHSLFNGFGKVQLVIIILNSIQYTFFPDDEESPDAVLLQHTVFGQLLGLAKQHIDDAKVDINPEYVEKNLQHVFLSYDYEMIREWLNAAEDFRAVIERHYILLMKTGLEARGKKVFEVTFSANYKTICSDDAWYEEHIQNVLIKPALKDKNDQALRSLLQQQIFVKNEFARMQIPSKPKDHLLLNTTYSKLQGYINDSNTLSLVIIGVGHVLRKTGLKVVKGKNGLAAKVLADASKMCVQLPRMLEERLKALSLTQDEQAQSEVASLEVEKAVEGEVQALLDGSVEKKGAEASVDNGGQALSVITSGRGKPPPPMPPAASGVNTKACSSSTPKSARKTGLETALAAKVSPGRGARSSVSASSMSVNPSLAASSMPHMRAPSRPPAKKRARRSSLCHEDAGGQR